MNRFPFLLILLALTTLPGRVHAQNSVAFREQFSGWTQVSPVGEYPFLTGVQYIPQVNFVGSPDERFKIDMEVSANIGAQAAFHRADEWTTEIRIQLYRGWARLSTKQSELRVGLQKINFGSATLLRPLSWFDQVDPRDPLQLTNGVWGTLGRYYFLNNATIWLWALYGNTKTKTWEIAATNTRYPEAGVRVQVPVPKGELALSYHFRIADSEGAGDSIPAIAKIPENRIGLDGKWDIGPGIWFEAAWITKSRDLGKLTNQAYLTAGIDYTFGVGAGLNVLFEQMVASYDQKPFQFSDPGFISALSVTYPLGLFDNLNGIFYFDWSHKNIYSFLTWKKQFNDLSLYIMGYWNPETALFPKAGMAASGYAGKGVRLLVVLNK